jgi:hypothetical protein
MKHSLEFDETGTHTVRDAAASRKNFRRFFCVTMRSLLDLASVIKLAMDRLICLEPPDGYVFIAR